MKQTDGYYYEKEGESDLPPIPIRVYCEDCTFRTGSRSYGYCSHIKLRQLPSFDYRQEDTERYPLCSIANRQGLCKLWEERELSKWKHIMNRLRKLIKAS